MISLNRKINFINQKYVEVTYENIINQRTIEKLSRRKINKIFKKEDSDLKDAFLHNIIDHWIHNNYEESIYFLNKLKKIIKKTKIEINILEKQNLQILEERIFSKERHIKVLLVERELQKNEYAGAKFTNASLFIKTSLLRNIMQGELIITNKKIIFADKRNIKNFSWKEISKIEYKKYGFLLTFENKDYVIRIHDQSSLNNTIQNFLNKKVKNFNPNKK